MVYKVTVENGEYVVNVDCINLEARFDNMDSLTEFIQSMITNITSY